MSRPQPLTVTVWVTILGFLVTIGTVVLTAGGDRNRMVVVERQVQDHELRIRSLEADRTDAAVTRRRMEDISNKVDELHRWLMKRESDTR